MGELTVKQLGLLIETAGIRIRSLQKAGRAYLLLADLVGPDNRLHSLRVESANVEGCFLDLFGHVSELTTAGEA